MIRKHRIPGLEDKLIYVEKSHKRQPDIYDLEGNEIE